jgi:hypothetical protein
MKRLRLQTVGWLTSLAAIALSGTGCLDLDVTNPNEPDRERALSEARDVESLIGGTFSTWWDVKQGRAPGRALSQSAEVHTSGSANHFTGDLGQQPRIPVPNQIGYQWGYPVDDPWNLLNRALAAIRDGLLAIEDGLQIGPNGVDNTRAIAFGKFMQGLNHGFIAKLYDRGFVIDETVDPEQMVQDGDLRPYGEVMQAARAYLAEARQLASQHNFTIPSEWTGRSYSSAQLVQLTHSYEARLMASVARTPEERAQVNWEQVLQHINQGITFDFGNDIEPGGVWSNEYKTANILSMRFVGPADQSGSWQAWEAADPRAREPFHVDTDDRRIHGADGPQADGIYIESPGQVFEDPQRGVWFLSYYRHLPWRQAFLDTGGFGFAPEMTLLEMDYLRAEALVRLGRPEEALPFINARRTSVGGLPPATVDGVSGDRCVPRTITGECADLLRTLLYEKQMETVWLSAGLDYWDQRGFGTLRAGTQLHFPIPAEELETLGQPWYTFGGVGQSGAAPGP